MRLYNEHDSAVDAEFRLIQNLCRTSAIGGISNRSDNRERIEAGSISNLLQLQGDMQFIHRIDFLAEVCIEVCNNAAGAFTSTAQASNAVTDILQQTGAGHQIFAIVAVIRAGTNNMSPLSNFFPYDIVLLIKDR